jgi:hypothetical protein
MDEQDSKPQINISIDANKIPVLYADAYLIGSNEHVLTLNFMQAMAPDPNQQNVVARVALTRNQAKDFQKSLKDHIEKYEV